MSIKKYGLHIAIIGAIVAIAGIFVGFIPILIFGTYWAGLGMGMSYDNIQKWIGIE